jgi:hypothetical protein
MGKIMIRVTVYRKNGSNFYITNESIWLSGDKYVQLKKCGHVMVMPQVELREYVAKMSGEVCEEVVQPILYRAVYEHASERLFVGVYRDER